jgi:hypothetical protein
MKCHIILRHFPRHIKLEYRIIRKLEKNYLTIGIYIVIPIYTSKCFSLFVQLKLGLFGFTISVWVQNNMLFQSSAQCKIENLMSRCVYLVPFVDLECHHQNIRRNYTFIPGNSICNVIPRLIKLQESISNQENPSYNKLQLLIFRFRMEYSFIILRKYNLWTIYLYCRSMLKKRILIALKPWWNVTVFITYRHVK